MEKIYRLSGLDLTTRPQNALGRASSRSGGVRQPCDPLYGPRCSQRHTGAVGEDTSIYARVGGLGFFVRLVRLFYDGVSTDALLRPMYPDDLEPARERLELFLAQYFGGPPMYDELRGHPRLRMRHAPFPIDLAAVQAWLGHMGSALQELTSSGEISTDDASVLRDYFDTTARFLLNRGGLSIVGSS